MQRTLDTSSSVAQLTMTACSAGMAIGQLVTGPVSDARGRRSLILLATLIFAATSVLCALVFSGWELIAARAVQGIACGAAAAVGRAVVTDTWSGRDAAAKFGSLSAVWSCLAVMTTGLGAYLPANSSITQAAGRRYAGTAMFAFFAVAATTAVLTHRAPVTRARNHGHGPVAAQEAATKESIP